MAQKDIEEIAKAMREAEEAAIEADKSYEEAQAELDKIEAEEDAADENENEILKPEAMGFVDSEDADESDDFYNEDDECTDEDDVSGCITENEDVDEAEEQASITIDVYDDGRDGYRFASKVMKHAPGTSAEVVSKKPRADGGVTVKVSGGVEDLRKAFAFYLGKMTFAELPAVDKAEFEDILTFEDGDTLKECDYRTAVAHCLDPVGIEASTANLAGQDTCAVSWVKEEKARRKAAKFKKALEEKDFSELTDAELDELEKQLSESESDEDEEGENIMLKKTTELNPEQKEFVLQMLKILGYTESQWNHFDPEFREGVWNRWAKEEFPKPTETGMPEFLTDKRGRLVKDKHGNPIKIPWNYLVYYPYDDKIAGKKQGDQEWTAFDPHYTTQTGIRKRATERPDDYNNDAANRSVKQNQDNLELIDALDDYDTELRINVAKGFKLLRDKMRRRSRDKKTWDSGDFGLFVSQLGKDEKAKLLKTMLDDVDFFVKGKRAAQLKYIIKLMFGEKPVIEDMMATLGIGRGTVTKFTKEVEQAIDFSLRDAGVNSIKGVEVEDDYITKFNKFINFADADKWQKFMSALKSKLERLRSTQRTGKNSNDDEEADDDRDYFDAKI